jgi:hypothetical protein
MFCIMKISSYSAFVQDKIKFDRPPRLKKLPESLIISTELRHLYRQTQNRYLDNTARAKRLDTSKRDTSC